jgi:phenylpropionate dioxygenase-like ring-hydroxylating dioxygenase large terminal subunit
MNLSSGHWFPVLSTRELNAKPVAKTRFGQALVFWRDADGQAVCLDDRCAHRGAALSLGKVSGGAVECPFHGFCFDSTGQCIRVPAEGEDWTIPDHFRVRDHIIKEGGGYIWAWRGPEVARPELPCLPQQPALEGLEFGETQSTWHSHYTRCIENVLDYSHLPFVHRKNLGAFIRDPVTRVSVEPFDDGFRFFLVGSNFERQFVEFTFPTLWANKIGKNYVLTTTFMPVNDSQTEVYVRWYHALPAILRPFSNIFGRLSQYIVFKDDLPIVASQRPANVDDAGADKLVPSDAGLVAFRKLRRTHQDEIRAFDTRTEKAANR